MELIINGERHDVRASRIRPLLDELGYEGTFLAVAVNHELVRRTRWDDVELAEGDEVEVVTPRQGG